MLPNTYAEIGAAIDKLAAPFASVADAVALHLTPSPVVSAAIIIATLSAFAGACIGYGIRDAISRRHAAQRVHNVTALLNHSASLAPGYGFHARSYRASGSY